MSTDQKTNYPKFLYGAWYQYQGNPSKSLLVRMDEGEFYMRLSQAMMEHDNDLKKALHEVKRSLVRSLSRRV